MPKIKDYVMKGCKQSRLSVYALWFMLIPVFSVAHAEEFLGIKYSWGMKELRSEFPGAKLIDLKPAWAKKEQRLIEIQGIGIDGSVVILLSKYTYENCKSARRRYFGEKDADKIESSCKYLKTTTFMRDATIEWVRWIPSRTILLQHFLEKYGEADTTELTQDMERNYTWRYRGVTLFVDEGSNTVSRSEYTPSVYEIITCDDEEIIPGEHANCSVQKKLYNAMTKAERQQLIQNLE